MTYLTVDTPPFTAAGLTLWLPRWLPVTAPRDATVTLDVVVDCVVVTICCCIGVAAVTRVTPRLFYGYRQYARSTRIGWPTVVTNGPDVTYVGPRCSCPVDLIDRFNVGGFARYVDLILLADYICCVVDLL